MKRTAAQRALPIIFALIAVYYYWEINPALGPISDGGYYSALTGAFAAGHTYLSQQPPPELLQLPDPYDPEQNRRYRAHDASLYKGKYYLYFGAAPVALLYLPFHELTGMFLAERIGTWFFAVAAYFIACRLLRLLLETWYPSTPQWLLPFLCLCLGFSNSYPFLLGRPAVYETAVVASQFFVLLALYVIARAALGHTIPLWQAGLSGVAAAAAFGSRAPAGLVAIAFAWFLILGANVSSRDRIRRLTAAAVPFALGVGLVLYYNFVRFDSPFEFGNRYQLAGTNMHKLAYLSPLRLVQSLWFSLLEPPKLRSAFPFTDAIAGPAPFRAITDSLGVDYVVGIVWLSPLVLFLAAAPFVWKRLDPTRRRAWIVFEGTFVALGAGWMAVDGMVGSTMRYQAEIATVWFLAAALVIAELSLSPRWKLNQAVVALGLFGVVLNGALGMTGYGGLRKRAPAEYRNLESVFHPVGVVLKKLGVPSEGREP